MKCAPSSPATIQRRCASPIRKTDLTKEQMLPWHRILYKRGWIAPLRPKQHGGAGWSIIQRLIFEQTTTRAGALPPLAFSITMQLHGGMGMTDELSVGHYFKRISSINIQFGDPAYHRLRYAQLEVAA